MAALVLVFDTSRTGMAQVGKRYEYRETFLYRVCCDLPSRFPRIAVGFSQPCLLDSIVVIGIWGNDVCDNPLFEYKFEGAHLCPPGY